MADHRGNRPSGADTGGPFVLAAGPADVLASVDHRLLTAAERRRAAALRHSEDQDAYVASHLLARECVAALTGHPSDSVRLEQRCLLCGARDHGRPFVAGRPDVHISLAHTRGAVVAAADLRPLGVDVESVPGVPLDPAALAIALTPAEAAGVAVARDPSMEFLRYWVRKEALLKVGVISLDGLAGIELGPAPEHDADDDPRASEWRGLHVLDWLDRRLDAVVAVACSAPPVLGGFPGPGVSRAAATRQQGRPRRR